MTTFHDIIHDEDILKAIDKLGFTEPTPIQEETIPLGLEGHDIIGQAKTGSGKTFAFGVPIMHELDASLKEVQALIIAPTRELTQQIAIEMKKLTVFKKARICTVYGGVGINPQIHELETAQIVVATPGRLLDHLQRGTIDPSHVKTFIMDEADRMFDMGFIEDIETIIRSLPEDRQMLLFSATMPDPIKRLAERHLHGAKHVKTSSHVEEEYLPQYYYVIDQREKFSLLLHLIKEERPERAIIFCGTRMNAEAVARNLKRHDIRADDLHGGLSQAKRNVTMTKFREGKTHLLIATDVAARGLDIQDVSHVINYDVPRNPEDYIHRIGRTARAGKSGKAITLLVQRDFEFFQMILDIVQTPPEQLDTPRFKTVGFRKHQQGDDGYQGDRRRQQGRGSYGDRRSGGRDGRRSGGRDSGPRKSFGGGRQRGKDDGGSAPLYNKEVRVRPQKKESGEGGWKQSMRRG